MTSLITGRLMDAHGDLSPKLRQTHEGMAHIAGTGPEGKTCRECRHWGTKRRVWDDEAQRYVEKPPAPFRWKAKGELANRRCAQFSKLMRACLGYSTVGKGVPHSAAACRHFDASDNPPPINKPKGAVACAS